MFALYVAVCGHSAAPDCAGPLMSALTRAAVPALLPIPCGHHLGNKSHGQKVTDLGICGLLREMYEVHTKASA